jgi:hypothetical protein
MSISGCPESVTGHMANAAGRCEWCGRKVEAALPKPDSFPVSELSEAYALTYDPDYGREDWTPHD